MNGVADEVPVHLLKPDESHNRLIPLEDALRLLESIKEPITVVAIVGSQRAGKSTIMNLLTKRNMRGFGVGHYMDPQTHGLWMRIREHPRDPALKVVLIDTEGLDAPHVTQFYNWALSALTVLISNFFIYQSKGSIDSAATDRLDVILRVAEQIGHDTRSDSADKPSFLWLLRDHQLNMRKTPKQEMMEKLDSAAQSSLKRCFADADCFPLPRPVENDERFREMESLRFEELSDRFRDEFVVLERKVLDSVLHPRNVNGRPMTGELLAELIRRYTDALFSAKGIVKEIAELPTQRQMLVRMAGERSIKTGLSKYEELMERALVQEPLPIELTRLESLHQFSLKEAVELFEREALTVMSDEEVNEYRLGMESKITEWRSEQIYTNGFWEKKVKLVGGVYFKYLSDNFNKSNAVCTNVVKKLFADVVVPKTKNGFAGYSGLSELKEDVESVRNQYMETAEARGPQKQMVLDQFVQDKFTSLKEELVVVLLRREFLSSLEQLSKSLGHSIQEQKDTLQRHVQTSEANQQSMTKQVDELNQKLSQSVELSETRMNLKVESLANSEKIQREALEHKLTQQREESDQALKQALDSTQNQLNSRIDSAIATERDARSTQLMENVNSLKQALDSVQVVTQGRIASLAESEQVQRESMEQRMNQQREEGIANLKEGIKNIAKSLKSSIEQVESKLASSQSSLASSLEEVNGRVSSVESQFRDQVEQIATSVRDLKQESAETLLNAESRLNSRDEQLHQQLTELTEALNSSSNQLSVLLENVNSDLNSLGTQCRASIAEHQALLDSLSNQFASTTSDITNKIESIDGRFTSQVDSLQSRVESLGTDLQTGLQRLAQDFETVHRKNQNQWEETSNDLNQQVTQLKIQLDAECSSMKESLESIQVSVKSDCESMKQEMSNHERSMQESIQTSSEGMRTYLQQYVEDLSKRFDDQLRSVSSESNQVTSRLEEVSSSLESQIHSLNQVMNELEQDLTTTRTEQATALTEAVEGLSSRFSGRLDSIQQSQEEKFLQLQERTNQQDNQLSNNRFDELTEIVAKCRDRLKKFEEENKRVLNSVQGEESMIELPAESNGCSSLLRNTPEPNNQTDDRECVFSVGVVGDGQQSYSGVPAEPGPSIAIPPVPVAKPLPLPALSTPSVVPTPTSTPTPMRTKEVDLVAVALRAASASKPPSDQSRPVETEGSGTMSVPFSVTTANFNVYQLRDSKKKP